MYTVSHLDPRLTVLNFKIFIKRIELDGYLKCKGRLEFCLKTLFFLCANMFYQPHQPEGVIL